MSDFVIDADVEDKDYLRLKNLHDKCFMDLTGKKFNKLTVISFDYKKRQPNGKYTYYWKCKCDCGNECSVVGGALTSNHTKSCGCAHKGVGLKDLTGNKYGRLTVLSYSRQDGKKHLWKCKCDCGNIIEANGPYLRNGTKTSCGCAKRKMNPTKRKYDLTGQRFGKLVVISPENHSNWLCKCDCGKDTIVKTADLLRGYTQSCGCIAFNCHGSLQEEDVRSFVQSILPNYVIDKVKILDDGSSRKKEIDIYIPALKIGIEYNGSAFHTSSGAKIGRNKPKTYHQNKFLTAKSQGIHLISLFDIDWLNNKDNTKELIKNILLNTVKHKIPTKDIVYTNNDYDDGLWLREYGYKEFRQLKPECYKISGYTVYRSGKTEWHKLDNTEVN